MRYVTALMVFLAFIVVILLLSFAVYRNASVSSTSMEPLACTAG